MTEVAIVGGGFSGTLLAINLLRHSGPDAAIYERRGGAGRGLAYSTASPVHLLNVRAANMSALPDDPAHFVRWVAENEMGTPRCFVPREAYGRYLSELLEQSRAEAASRLCIEPQDIVEIRQVARDFELRLATGETRRASHVILAMGNLPPHPPPHLDPVLLPCSYCDDPWSPDLARDLGPENCVLLLGTGLTAIDVSLLLAEAGFVGRIVAVSRRGLLPRPHDESGPPPALEIMPRPEVRAILRHLRQQSQEIGWRQAIDQLRPHSQKLWQRMPLFEQQRFLRHARPWWDVHRHRLAPAVAEQVDAMRATGRLRIVAGRVRGGHERDGQALVDIATRTGTIETIRARRVINCTGPSGDLQRARDPLLARLRSQGLAQPDRLGMGIAVDRTGRVLGADGKPNPRLHAVGPLTRGTFWEITAVPDIRLQVWSLARRLSNAHWVEGEGL